MLTAGKEAAIKQCGLHRNNLQSHQLLLDRIGQTPVAVNVVEHHSDDLDRDQVDRRALIADLLGQHRERHPLGLTGPDLLERRQRIDQRCPDRLHWQPFGLKHRRIRQNTGHPCEACRLPG